MTTEFSAAPQALGYYYQIRYALYLLVAATNDLQISIERIDDIEAVTETALRSLLQLKHHIGDNTTITNTHKDLWKTVLVWATYLSDGRIIADDTRLLIVTNASTAPNSIPSLLRIDRRNVDSALTKMKEVASKSADKKLKAAFDKFKSLTDNQQKMLVNAIYVLDLVPDVANIANEIKRHFITIEPKYRDALFNSLEGWWIEKVVHHLLHSSSGYITSEEVHQIIIDRAEQLPPRTLPLMYSNTVPDNNLSEERPLYIRQLLSIQAGERAINLARRDYIRAFNERTYWVKHRLLVDDDTLSYDRRLKEKWEQCLAIIEGEFESENGKPISEADEDTCRKFGFRLYNEVTKFGVPIRTFLVDEYVTRGSYHMLADKQPLVIGWHPNYQHILEQLLETA